MIPLLFLLFIFVTIVAVATVVVIKNKKVFCKSGFVGNNCQYSDSTTCSGNGTAQYNGTCVCNAGYAGSNCQYSNAVTCGGNGIAQSNGSCVCNTGYAGSNCQYSDSLTCNNGGIAQSDGSCVCDTTHIGINCSISFPNSTTTIFYIKYAYSNDYLEAIYDSNYPLNSATSSELFNNGVGFLVFKNKTGSVNSQFSIYFTQTTGKNDITFNLKANTLIPSLRSGPIGWRSNSNYGYPSFLKSGLSSDYFLDYHNVGSSDRFAWTVTKLPNGNFTFMNKNLGRYLGWSDPTTTSSICNFGVGTSVLSSTGLNAISMPNLKNTVPDCTNEFQIVYS